MQTKASFRLICANITAAEKEAARVVEENARVPVKSHIDVIQATKVLNVLPTLAVIDEAALTNNELKAYEQVLLEPISAGKIKFCAMCGQEIEDGATMCSFCGTEIGKSNEIPLLEEIPMPLIPKAVKLMESITGPKKSKPSDVSLPEPESISSQPLTGIPAAMPELLGRQPDEGQSELEMAALEAFVVVEGARVARETREADGYEENIEHMSEKELYSLLAESTARLKPLMLMAKEKRIDISEGKQLLSEVVRFSRIKETKKAVTAMHLADKAIRGAIKLKFLRNISMLENEVAELRSAWVGVARAQKLIISAKDFLKAGEYLEVPMNLDDAGNGLEPFRMALSK